MRDMPTPGLGGWQTPRPAAHPRLFRSFVQGGFECSTHRRRDGRRLDVIAATAHDRHAAEDYRQLVGLGLATMRDGLRWHLIDRGGSLDLTSWDAMARAGLDAGAEIIWDLMHYGWPDDVDIWRPAFVDRLERLARAAALRWREMTDAVPFWCPVNEISFFSWGGGDVGYLNPFGHGRGFELKVQLARAAVAASHALRDVDPRARLVHCEPLIAIHHDPRLPHSPEVVQGAHDAQYQAFDLVSGRLWPQIGGAPELLDILGLNYYPNNQWVFGGERLHHDDPRCRPLSALLTEVASRYDRPIFLAETGCEGDLRAPWLRRIADQVALARARGVPVEGLCLYPVMNHPGWDDDRPCPNGLLRQDRDGHARRIEADVAAEVAIQVRRFGPPGNKAKTGGFIHHHPTTTEMKMPIYDEPTRTFGTDPRQNRQHPGDQNRDARYEDGQGQNNQNQTGQYPQDLDQDGQSGDERHPQDPNRGAPIPAADPPLHGEVMSNDDDLQDVDRDGLDTPDRDGSGYRDESQDEGRRSTGNPPFSRGSTGY